MHAEGGMRKLNLDKVRTVFARAFNKQGGILAVIGPPGAIRAMLYLLIATYYYTDESHLEELWCFVHPQHRRSDYAKILIEYAKKCSDDLTRIQGEKVPLLMGVLTNKQMSAKVRLYRKFFGWPAGASFVHNATWVTPQEPAEEDFWRLPALAKALYRRTQVPHRNGAGG